MTVLLLVPITVIDRIKDPFAVVMMIEVTVTTAATSAETKLTSMFLPVCLVVSRSIVGTESKFITTLEMAFIFVRIVISMTFMIAVVWLSRHSIRLYEIKVSSLFEALADVSMPEIRSSTITELWFLIHLAIIASPGWLVLSSLMTF